ncbi:MAG: ABC transporter [Candidatus Lumbricidophila eiseniae]|uniref:ABC transporter n=1 Tax=Candidatus Lumbricidiphila eiseniae TaxID=1969409 RepID=A0A2A6FNQ6_9MICO|nr:MAG: ABC transporter [Candidatus Lumbricidophila eiseniae]
MSDTLLRASGVRKSFVPGHRATSVPVLNGISLTVRRGEVVAIVGPSGSGKSTLLYCLSGLDPISAGSVALLGREIGELSRSQLARLRREHIGFIFQNYNLISSLTARENIALPTQLAHRAIGESDIARALENVDLVKQGDLFSSQLSGGQQQRVAIARALATKPDLVFADEPTGALDAQTGSSIMTLLRRIPEDGRRSVVVVTHELDYAASADRVLVLVDGRIHTELHTPSPEKILTSLSEAKAAAPSIDLR